VLPPASRAELGGRWLSTVEQVCNAAEGQGVDKQLAGAGTDFEKMYLRCAAISQQVGKGQCSFVAGLDGFQDWLEGKPLI